VSFLVGSCRDGTGKTEKAERGELNCTSMLLPQSHTNAYSFAVLM
jgi:hypothetical protein